MSRYPHYPHHNDPFISDLFLYGYDYYGRPMPPIILEQAPQGIVQPAPHHQQQDQPHAREPAQQQPAQNLIDIEPPHGNPLRDKWVLIAYYRASRTVRGVPKSVPISPDDAEHIVKLIKGSAYVREIIAIERRYGEFFAEECIYKRLCRMADKQEWLGEGTGW
ncbi:hypothetical protein EK21DRAFT_89936 [Setomelanomma holmii]|uniref:Uncharacterized protein n=1 Tax=Setomelanomma holmii TaxID=210430 RepID=A0A9P4LLG9_9PLEO|nr:hypothetical protein EK21DRAFT_89936 [Setomelanomma holmii]